MTTQQPLHAVVAPFLDLVQRRDLAAAGALATAQLREGYRAEQVIVDLLAPAQAEVGRRWQEALWTVADEHQATAVTDAALFGVTADTVLPRCIRGTAAVVCASGDWHTLPSRMAAELLRLDGWEVLFLGGSLPTADLIRWLDDARPDCLVVSCSMPTTARSIVDTAQAAAGVGVPVVVGGRGMGPDDRRAAALGARWAGDLTSLEAALAAPAPATDPQDLRDRLSEHSELILRREHIVAAAVEELGQLWPPMADLTGQQIARTREDFGHIVDFLGAAVATGDEQLFAEYTDWLTVVLSARHVPAAVLHVSFRALVAAIPFELPTAAGLIAAASARSPSEVS